MRVLHVEQGEKMIKYLVHDPFFLSVKSDLATKEDLWIAQDLLDTLYGAQGQLCRYGGKYDWCTQTNHHLSRREWTNSYIHGDAQSRDYQKRWSIQHRGKLSVASRWAPPLQTL